MRRWAPVVLGVALAGVAVLAAAPRMASDDPATWHVDPAGAQRTGAPNDYLVGPAGATAATPDRTAEARPVPPRELLVAFDTVATSAPRTRRIAGSPDGGLVTYVQRSRIFGFPDYVSAKAVEVPGGSALVVWSRSRFGYGDFGVNRARVDDWLARTAATQS